MIPRAVPAVDEASPSSDRHRIRVAGKHFVLGAAKWYVKGLTYGPFAPNAEGLFLPRRKDVLADLAHLRRLGANAVRVYHPPPQWLLDAALEDGLRVLIDVPWDKHRCFFEDRAAQRGALAAVRSAAKNLGSHPGTFAVSVANEIPHDVVRFYGGRRIGRFINDLLAAAKDAAPECLVTYTNYPPTEFIADYLDRRRLDFSCANVYLHDEEALGRYLERLQHVAGPLPLVLGEYGTDSMRNGLAAQAEDVARHVRQVFRRGLAGSFVFSFTDEWFTGGHPIEDWAFGVTDRHRNDKPAAAALRDVWASVPHVDEAAADTAGAEAAPPRVSVVVCTYNGAATLAECLESMTRLDYGDYEVIVVDDGSTDDTPRIAAGFVQRYPRLFRLIRQDNLGLSAARNAGAAAATGQVVAYTDDDCAADEHWLRALVRAMREQGVDAAGGPNVPPGTEGWVAQCVAASPGGPGHVMLDDRYAEHVPGCNMAFDRGKLLALGGFDVRFRQAGDDVDLCWRWLDAGLSIGYAPSALVWHRRRASVLAYLRQQKGYGRSEAMLQFKHPHRFNALGSSRWRGVIYAGGSALPAGPPTVFHGQFGAGLFQIVYRTGDYSAWSYLTLIEWHAAWLGIAALALLPGLRPLMLVSGAMLLAGVVAAARLGLRASLPPRAPWWCRPTVVLLHLAQPVVRAGYRYAYRLRHKGVPRLQPAGAPGDAASAAQALEPSAAPPAVVAAHVKRVAWGVQDLHLWSGRGRGRQDFLVAMVEEARRADWPGDFLAEWHDHDVELIGGVWNRLRVRVATEELGGPQRFTRVRCALRWTRFARAVLAVELVWAVAALATGQKVAAAAGLAALVATALAIVAGRVRCRRAVARLVLRAAATAGLDPVPVKTVAAPAAPAHAVSVASPNGIQRRPTRSHQDHHAGLPDDEVPALAD